MNHKPILLGCAGRGVQNSSPGRPVSLDELPVDTQFRMVVESGVFDFFDRLPLTEKVDDYVRAVEKYDLPVWDRPGPTGSAPSRCRCSKAI